MALIGRSQEHSNKELNKMRRDIEAVLAKYSAMEVRDGQ
jgi:septum formation topological specificity factor MinE